MNLPIFPAGSDLSHVTWLYDALVAQVIGTWRKGYFAVSFSELITLLGLVSFDTSLWHSQMKETSAIVSFLER